FRRRTRAPEFERKLMLIRARRGERRGKAVSAMRAKERGPLAMIAIGAGLAAMKRGSFFADLIAPSRPAFARAAREQFEIWPGATRFDELVQLVRLARVLALARRQQIHLPPSGSR